MSTKASYRLGIVGAHPEWGWAKITHLPAIACVPRFKISAVSAPSLQRAKAAQQAFGATHAFADSLDLVRSPHVDVVVVTVRVPDHKKIVMAAIDAGKDVYCEWPLGRNLKEAEEMAAAAARAGIRTMVGLQALGSPVVRSAANIVNSGALGRITSARMLAPSLGWGPVTAQPYAYLNDESHGATLLTIPGGHTLAPMERILGKFVSVQALATTHYPKVQVLDINEMIDRNCADHLSILGTHASGCVSTVEIPGNRPVDAEFLFEVTGSKGELRIVGIGGGGFQTAELTLQTQAPYTLPAVACPGLTGTPVNVAELYASFARELDGDTADTADFEHAVGIHRLLTVVDRAAKTGHRQFVS